MGVESPWAPHPTRQFDLWRVVAGAAVPAAWILVPLLLWEVCGRMMRLPAHILPLPSAIVEAAARGSDALLAHAGHSTLLILEGFLAGAVPAVALGLAMAAVPIAERALYPLVVFVQTTPQVAIAPLLTVWFGYGALPKIILAGLLTFFPVLVDSATGFKSVDRRLGYVTQSMGASRWQFFRHIQWPSAIPFIIAGCKISMLISVTVIVVVEFISSNEGLGYVAVRALANHDLALMFAAIAAAIAVGLVLNGLIEVGERILTPWARHEESGA